MYVCYITLESSDEEEEENEDDSSDDEEPLAKKASSPPTVCYLDYVKFSPLFRLNLSSYKSTGSE